MSNQNQTRALAASVAITAVIVLSGAWWVKTNFIGDADAGPLSGPLQIGSFAQDREIPNITIGSDGTSGLSMLPGSVASAKQKGLDAMAAGDFATAQVEFLSALGEKKNDPESLIYLNNAKIGDGDAYTIALSVPASKFSNPSLEMMRGVAQAQEQLNSSVGINGKPLKVLLFDDQGKPEQAKVIATDLAANSEVLGVVGHYSSDTTIEAAKVYESNGLPVISPTSTAVKIADAGEFVFRTVPSDRLAAATLARHTLNGLKKKKAAIFYNSESTYSKSVKSEFATELLSNGGEVVAEYDTAEPGFSVSQAVKQAKEQGADVLMLGLTLGNIDIPIQVMAINQNDLPIVASDSLYSPRVLDVGRDNAVGMTIAVPWHTLSHEQSPFVSSARQLWGGDVNWRTATAYDATMALAAGIEKSPSRKGIADALANTSFAADGATESVRFFSNGDRNQTSQLVTIKQGNRTSSGYEFVPVEP